MEGYPQLKLPAQLFASVSVLFNQTPPSMYNNCCLSDHLYGSCERYFFFCQCCYRATSPWTLDVYWHSPRNECLLLLLLSPRSTQTMALSKYISPVTLTTVTGLHLAATSVASDTLRSCDTRMLTEPLCIHTKQLVLLDYPSCSPTRDLMPDVNIK